MENSLWQSVVTQAADVLEPLGFRRAKRTFTVNHDGIVHVVHLQSSDASTARSLRFTVNVGVYSLPLAETLGDTRARVTFWECHWQLRIGDLMPGQPDAWWTVSSPDEADRIGELVAVVLREYVLPALDLVSSARAFHEMLSSGRGQFIDPSDRQRYLAALAISAPD